MSNVKTIIGMAKYYCPYCNTDDIVETDTYFKCKKCNSKFDKFDFTFTEDKSDLLSIGELKGIMKVLNKNKPKGKDLSELFKDINEDSK